MTSLTILPPKSIRREGAQNPHKLPLGDPIRREMARIFREQSAGVVESIIRAGEFAPDVTVDLDPNAEAIAGRLAPLLSPLWHRGGVTLLGKLGLNHGHWDGPKPDLVRAAALTCAGSVNEATLATVQAILTKPMPAGRIKRFFRQPERPRRIAEFEASRAYHAGMVQAAKESGAVAGWEWLTHPNAGEACRDIHASARFVRFGQPFAVTDDYAVHAPPMRPGCRCSLRPITFAEMIIDPPQWAIEPHAMREMPAIRSVRVRPIKAEPPSIPDSETIVRRAGRQLKLNWRKCSPKDRLRLLHQVRLVARGWMRREADALARELYPPADEAIAAKAFFGDTKVAVERFFDRAGRFIRNAVTAGWLAVAGPQMPTRVEAETLDHAVAEQQVFLRQFEQETMEEQKPFLPARAEMYGSSVWGAAQDAAIAGAKSKIFREARREHIGPRTALDPCNGCASWERKGWVPIEEIPPIGSQECRENCHCMIWVRDDEDGPEYPLGQLPNVGRNIAPQNFRSLGVRFRQSDTARALKNKTLIIDVAKLDKAWSRDKGYYIGPGQENRAGSRNSFREYLEKAQREGLPIDQSRVLIDADGTVSFEDGRHRFAYLRDRGIDRLPVSVPAEDYTRMKRKFGWRGPDVKFPKRPENEIE